MNITPPRRKQGFTLIELSIVLVIIGLIIGGVLLGQDLVSAAATRATLTQIEKYNTAANTFKNKYGYIPGDIPDPYASQFGFQARGPYAGEGDGNGVIEGNTTNTAGSNIGNGASNGENVVFWVDLSTAGFVDGNFTAGHDAVAGSNIYSTSAPPINSYLPLAKLGNGNNIYVYSVNGQNYYGISNVTIIGNGMASNPALSVQQAYVIDKKIDDGYPMTGRVTAFYVTNHTGFPLWSNNISAANLSPDTTATTGASTTCYDNGGNAANTMQYSTEINNGSNPNCALSFKMQGAAR